MTEDNELSTLMSDEDIIEFIGTIEHNPPKVNETGTDFVVMYDKLASLETIKEIALFLEELGIKGKKSAASFCPISAYFYSEGHNVVTLFSSLYLAKGNGEYIPVSNTGAMMGFISEFDSGRWPELEERA